MNVEKFLSKAGSDSLTSVDDSQVVTVNREIGRDELAVQIAITGTASIDVQGYIDADLGWATLQTITASGVYYYAKCRALRLDITAISGTVKASAGY